MSGLVPEREADASALQPNAKPELVSIVCPAYNEAESVGELVGRVAEIMTQATLDYEIVLVNDGSSDATLPILKRLARERPELTVVNLTRNFGKEIAIALDCAASELYKAKKYTFRKSGAGTK